MLSYDLLREAMDARIGAFEDRNGEAKAEARAKAFQRPLSYWCMALAGEMGEMCNLIKKVERGDYTLETLIKDNHTGEKITVRAAIAKEAGDIEAYQTLIAIFLDFDLGEAVKEKFNEISSRTGSKVFIVPTETHDDQYPGLKMEVRK